MKLLVFVVTVAFHIVFLIDESSLHKVIVRTCFDINLPLLFVSFISLLFVVVVVVNKWTTEWQTIPPTFPPFSSHTHAHDYSHLILTNSIDELKIGCLLSVCLYVCRQRQSVWLTERSNPSLSLSRSLSVSLFILYEIISVSISKSKIIIDYLYLC